MGQRAFTLVECPEFPSLSSDARRSSTSVQTNDIGAAKAHQQWEKHNHRPAEKHFHMNCKHYIQALHFPRQVSAI